MVSADRGLPQQLPHRTAFGDEWTDDARRLREVERGGERVDGGAFAARGLMRDGLQCQDLYRVGVTSALRRIAGKPLEELRRRCKGSRVIM